MTNAQCPMITFAFSLFTFALRRIEGLKEEMRECVNALIKTHEIKTR